MKSMIEIRTNVHWTLGPDEQQIPMPEIILVLGTISYGLNADETGTEKKLDLKTIRFTTTIERIDALINLFQHLKNEYTTAPAEKEVENEQA